MRNTALLVLALAVVCVAGCPRSGQEDVSLDEGPVKGKQAAVTQDEKPWTKPGTAAGQEIVGPDGGTMVWVPAGSFRMGTTAEDVEYAVEKDEQPARQVEMDGCWIGKHEVTNAQYRAFCAATGREWQFDEDSDQGDEHPVVSVSWGDALAYCEHYGLSLPTEAQWEYAARGPDSRIFPWGNEWDGSRLCWWEKPDPRHQTLPVGSFVQGASWCGALDMAGNVGEWCADWYQENYYKNAPSKNPPGPSSVEFKVLRGGSWLDDNPRLFRCAYRNYFYSVPDYRSIYSGFRCARGL